MIDSFASLRTVLNLTKLHMYPIHIRDSRQKNSSCTKVVVGPQPPEMRGMLWSLPPKNATFFYNVPNRGIYLILTETNNFPVKFEGQSDGQEEGGKRPIIETL